MKRRWLAAFLVAACGFVSSPAFAGEGEEEARRSITSARELYASGNWETAKEAYEEAFKAAPDGSITKAEAALEWSSLLWEQGDYAAAESRARDAMKRAKDLGLDQAVGRLLLTLGHIEASKGKFNDAENTLKICARSAREQKDQTFESLCSINLRFVRQLRGRSVPPESKYRADLNRLKKSGNPVLVGTALAKSAELQEKAGDHAGALNTLKRAQQEFVAAESLPAKSRNKLRVAQTLQNLNRWDEAKAELDGLVLTFQNMSNRPALVTAYALRGKQRVHDGDTKGALKDLQRARTQAGSLGSPQLTANIELGLCEFWANASKAERAQKHCAAAGKGFSAIGVPTLAARSHILVARLAQQQEEWLTSRKEYLAALKILEEDVSKSARDDREVAVQRVNLCQVEMKLKANGAHQRCAEALKDLDGVKATDASFRQMLAATQYAVGVTAGEERAKRAREALEAAAREWTSLQNRPQAAEAYLRLGKLQLDERSLRKAAYESFDKGLSTLGPVTDAPRAALATQLRIQKAQLELEQEKYKAAKDTLDALVKDSTKYKDDYSSAWAYSALAQAELKLGNRDDAIEALKAGAPLARKAGDKELEKLIRRNLSKLEKKP